MDNNLIFSLGCFSYILSCIFFAAIRWGHVCSPYVKYADQFFPARKISIVLLLFAIILFPYVFHPMRPEAWILVKFYNILVMPMVWIILFHKYFDPSGYKREKHKLRLMASVPILIILLLFVLSIAPKNLSEQQINQITYIGTSIGAFLFGYLVYSTFWLYRKTNEYNRDNYSNEEEFPVRFANYVLWQPLVYSLTGWIVLFVDNRLLKACCDFLLSSWNIIILIASLHPNRSNAAAMQKLDEVIAQYIKQKSLIPQSDDTEPENTESISAERVNLIKADILEIVERRQGFLNPHLTLASVAAQTDYGRTYVSKVFKQEFGGFYNYINRLRLAYAARYADEHPEASQDEIARQSGFSSRISQWRAAGRLARREDATV